MFSLSKKFMVEVQLLHHFHNVYIIFKVLHHFQNVYSTLVIRNFQTVMHLSNQHHQIKICEASHFCIILELVAYKLIFFVKTNIYLCHTKTARNVHFGNMKFTWKKMNSCSRCIFYLFLEIKKTACYLCVTC